MQLSSCLLLEDLEDLFLPDGGLLFILAGFGWCQPWHTQSLTRFGLLGGRWSLLDCGQSTAGWDGWSLGGCWVVVGWSSTMAGWLTQAAGFGWCQSSLHPLAW